MYEESEEEKMSLLGDRRYPESGGGRSEKWGTAEVEFEEDEEDETETENSPESEGFVDVDGKDGKKRNPLKKLRLKQKKKKIQEVPEVVISNPKRGAPTIEELQRELEEAENIMRNKVEQLLNDRDQRLENVLDRSERLFDAANDFARVSRRARIRMYLRSNKWNICICTAVVLIVIAGVIVTVAILISKGIIKIQT